MELYCLNLKKKKGFFYLENPIMSQRLKKNCCPPNFFPSSSKKGTGSLLNIVSLLISLSLQITVRILQPTINEDD